MFDLHNDTRLRRRQDQPGHRKREGIRDLGYEQLPRQQRSLLDGGLSRRNLVLRYPTREYEPDHASRTRQACRPLSRATAANQRRPDGQLLTSAPPYEPKGGGKVGTGRLVQELLPNRASRPAIEVVVGGRFRRDDLVPKGQV